MLARDPQARGDVIISEPFESQGGRQRVSARGESGAGWTCWRTGREQKSGGPFLTLWIWINLSGLADTGWECGAQPLPAMVAQGSRRTRKATALGHQQAWPDHRGANWGCSASRNGRSELLAGDLLLPSSRSKLRGFPGPDGAARSGRRRLVSLRQHCERQIRSQKARELDYCLRRVERARRCGLGAAVWQRELGLGARDWG